MTVIGIGGCMGLILVGFGLQDSITAIAKNQFVSLFTYQANAVLNSDVDESEKEALQTDLENYSGIDELLEMYCQNIELQTDKKTVDAVLEVPKELTNSMTSMPSEPEKAEKFTNSRPTAAQPSAKRQQRCSA